MSDNYEFSFAPSESHEDLEHAARAQSETLEKQVEMTNAAGEEYRKATAVQKVFHQESVGFLKNNRQLSSLTTTRIVLYTFSLFVIPITWLFDWRIGGYEGDSFMEYGGILLATTIVFVEPGCVLFKEIIKEEIIKRRRQLGRSADKANEGLAKLLKAMNYIAIAFIAFGTFYTAYSMVNYTIDRRQEEASVMAFDPSEYGLSEEEIAELGEGNEETKMLQKLQHQLGWLAPLFLTGFSFSLHMLLYRTGSPLYWAFVYYVFVFRNQRRRKTFYRLRNARETAITKCAKMYNKYKADSVAFVRENPLVRVPNAKFTRHVHEAHDIFMNGDSTDFLEYPTFESIKVEDSGNDQPPADTDSLSDKVPPTTPKDGTSSQTTAPTFTTPTS